MVKEKRKIPRLRFPGFADSWEQRKLGNTNTIFTDGNYGELYPKASDMTNSLQGVPFLTGGNLKDGKLDITGASYITREKHKELTSGHLVEDDIVIAVRGSLGALGYVDKDNSDWNINSQLAILRTDKNELSGKFLLQYLLSNIGQKELIRRQTGTALKQLPIGSIKDVAVPVTSLDEQIKIGNLLSDLDNLITLHQRKHDDLLKYKKGLLQKMFPKKGEVIPEIRFPGFADPWEQCKLEECLSEITYGFTNPMSDTEVGPWKITAKDIVDGNIDYSSARHTSQREYDVLTDKSKPLVGDLLLTKDGTLGRTAIVNVESICINQSVALLRFNEKCSNQYAKTLLDTPMYQKQMLDDAGGGTIKHIYITKVDKMSISIPSMEEQEQLVRFFINLDNLITLHQRKIDVMKEYKKGLLQQMLV